MPLRTATDDDLAAALNNMYKSGRSAALSTPERTRGFVNSVTAAAISAKRKPGCEVRVTCRDANEAVFAGFTIEKALEKVGLLDVDRSTFMQIELTNGSCIVIRIEGQEQVPCPETTSV